MANPFDLYSGKEHRLDAIKCTKKIKKAWKDFCTQLREIRKEFDHVGADDTVSREEISDWVAKRADDGDLM